MKNTRAFLKWAGSKYNCLNHVLSTLPAGERLIEPFTGSGVVFLNTHYPSYLLAESNHDLIYLFSTLQHEGTAFIEYCKSYFTTHFNCKEQYYAIRDEFNQLPPSPKRAALFVYLNRHGYNGLCRYNSSGGYNVPFGRYVNPYFPLSGMLHFHQKSQQAQFIHNDFRETFTQATQGDVIYCDPPYVLLNEKGHHVPYTEKKFTDEDHIELAKLAKETAAKGIPVILSNHDTEFIRHHYQEAQIHSFSVSRFINCQTGSRQPANELIAVFSNSK